MRESEPGAGRLVLARLGLALTSLLFSLGSVELGLRAAGYEPLVEVEDKRLQLIEPSEDPVLAYELRPGATGRIWKCDVQINSLGMRDREYEPVRPEGTRRVLALGDSITFGNRLELEKTWTSLYEDNLARRGIACEVLNMGVGGYDTLQEVRLLERAGLELDPDLVVLSFCVNDVATVSVSLEALERAKKLESSLLVRTRIGQWLALQSLRRQEEDSHRRRRDAELEGLEHLDDPELRRLSLRVAELLPDTLPDTPPEGVGEESARVELEHLWWYRDTRRLSRVRQAFERLSELAGEHDFRVVFFCVPFLGEAKSPLREAWHAVYAMIDHEARRAGFRVVDMLPALEEDGLTAIRVKTNDPIHPNGRGHRTLARVLAADTARLLH